MGSTSGIFKKVHSQIADNPAYHHSFCFIDNVFINQQILPVTAAGKVADEKDRTRYRVSGH